MANRREAILELAQALEQYDHNMTYNKLHCLYFQDNQVDPITGLDISRHLYKKHMEFFKASAEYSELAFIAANRAGKTRAGGVATAYHLTGDYPDWWEGVKFNHGISAWAIGVSNASMREVLQLELLGPDIKNPGTGCIPRDKILKITQRPGMPNAVMDVIVQHKSGDVSTLSFLSYEMDKAAFMGTKKHWIWMDEECPNWDIYSECVMRTMGCNGRICMTYTPLTGLNDIILQFMPGVEFPKNGVVLGEDGKPNGKYTINCTWDDAPHLTAEEKEKFIKKLLPHELEARTKGRPAIGSGLIYAVPEAEWLVAPFAIPDHWLIAAGLDFGWTAPTAAAWKAKDPQTNVEYIFSEYYATRQIPAVHAVALKSRGEWVNFLSDPAGQVSSVVDGTNLFQAYRKERIQVFPAENAISSGISSVYQKLSTGMLKIFSTCTNLINEMRVYRYGPDGKPAKNQADHALDAMRYLENGFDEIAQSKEDVEQKLWDRDEDGFGPNDGANDITGY